MNLLLFTARDRLDGKHIRVVDRRLQHLLEVHGAQPGDTLRVGELGGQMGEAIIVDIDTDHALLSVTLDTPAPAKLPLSLVLALPRPKMLRRILRAVAEFGLAELHLINSYRVEKSYWQTPALEPDTVQDYLLLGLEQARDTVLPTVQYHRRFKPFVEDELPAMVAGRTCVALPEGS